MCGASPTTFFKTMKTLSGDEKRFASDSGQWIWWHRNCCFKAEYCRIFPAFLPIFAESILENQSVEVWASDTSQPFLTVGEVLGNDKAQECPPINSKWGELHE